MINVYCTLALHVWMDKEYGIVKIYNEIWKMIKIKLMALIVNNTRGHLDNIVCVIYILGQYFKYIFETKISELQCDSMSG